mmetsp:Transcript_25433/g.31179  ORF Transcript_25433/g.31179 Transcript_25433/m.31179 type:complete len:99 (-) Transcript_25433:1454-1750(-)
MLFELQNFRIPTGCTVVGKVTMCWFHAVGIWFRAMKKLFSNIYIIHNQAEVREALGRCADFYRKEVVFSPLTLKPQLCMPGQQGDLSKRPENPHMFKM